LWVGAGAAAIARLTRGAYRARRSPAKSVYRLTVRPTVAPELVDDLTDLLRRVAGRAASDEGGAITITFAPGVEASDLERELRTVLDRWSDMHPGVRVRVLPGVSLPTRRWRRHRAIPSESQVHASARALETAE
jgi:hypothetical protein